MTQAQLDDMTITRPKLEGLLSRAALIHPALGQYCPPKARNVEAATQLARATLAEAEEDFGDWMDGGGGMPDEMFPILVAIIACGEQYKREEGTSCESYAWAMLDLAKMLSTPPAATSPGGLE